MWIGVIDRFRTFEQNLQLTEAQIEDGVKKVLGVQQCLNRHYYGSSHGMEHCFLVGSWGKGTLTRPPRDIDIYFVLPAHVFQRFSTNVGNRQSALLQEVKNVLARTYSTTEMRGDGQVVVVKFSTMNVEVVPAFSLGNDRYLICDTHDGGRYVETAPKSEWDCINSNDTANADNLRPLIKMLKAWQAYCSVPIKSFQLELVVVEFLRQSPWRLKGYFYYDWLMRDFFAFLYHSANRYVYVPGTNEPIFLGDAWQSRAESAYGRALKACEYEQLDLVRMAGEEWQKIFGPQIRKNQGLGLAAAALLGS